MNKKSRNKTTKALALALACTCVVGSFAYFTDRVDNSDDRLSITLDDKGIDIRPVDPTNPDPTDPDPTPGTTIENIWDANNEGSVENKDLFPGEQINLDFDVVNGSDAAVDIRETIILTVKDYNGNPIALQDVLGESEYEVWQSSADDGYGALDGVNDLSAIGTINRGDINNNTIVYKLNPFTLDGKQEVINGSKGNRAELAYKLVMDKLAKNAFQASTCQIDYIIEAKQHAEGGADKGWVEVANKTLTIGGNDYTPFVPSVAEQTP